MRVVFVIFLLGWTLGDDQFLIDLESALKTCSKDWDIDLFNADGDLLNTRVFRCFSACVLRGVRISDVDGNLNVDRIKQMLPVGEGGVTEAARKCEGENLQGDPCLRVFKRARCVEEKFNIRFN